MQEQNNEDTLPTRVQSTDSTQKMNAGETLPVQVKMSAPASIEPPAQSPLDDAETQPVQVPPAKPSRARRWPWFLLGFFLILLFGGIGSYLGYRSAIELRKSSYAEQLVSLATEHFMLGLEAQKNGQYEIARQQFEFVILKDPSFPGAAAKLTEVMIAMASTTTPTTAPTSTLIPMTPTPDLRSQEQIFGAARQYFVASDWDNLMVAIDSLRTVDPGYRSIEVDGMLYVAFRFRGIRKIYQEANLEGGIYDLALSERFAPLDSDADGARTWARHYLNGVSFWGADWARVVNSFEQIYPYFPNLRDSTGMTATERYRYASIEQAKVLEGRGDGCGALEYYNKALAVAPDAGIEQKATEVYLVCYPPTATPAPTETPTATVPVIIVPTELLPLPVDTLAPVETPVQPPVEIPTSTPSAPITNP